MNSQKASEQLEQRIQELEKRASELEEIEAKLRRSEKRFRELAELLPETIYEMDLENNLTFVNRKAFGMFGYTQEDFDKGIKGLNMISPKDQKRAAENIAKIMTGKELGLRNYEAIRKDGSTFPVMIHSVPITHEGRTTGIRGFIIDMTEKQQIEAQLREAQKMEAIGTLTGGIAHDFNNILTIIMANSELAIHKLAQENQSSKYLERILDASLRARDVVSQLLTFSRTKEKDTMPLRISYILKESLKFLRATIPNNINAVSLTRCFIFKEKPFLFNSMISWIFSIWPNSFSCLNEYSSKIFDNFSHFINGSFKQENDSILHLRQGLREIYLMDMK